MTSLDRPACGHVCCGRSAIQSTASNAFAVMIGRKKSREYLTQEAFEKCWAHSPLRAAARYFHNNSNDDDNDNV